MTGSGDTELAVAVGRVEEGVKHLNKSQELTSANFIGFQQSTTDEFDKVHGRITKVEGRVTSLETTIRTNFKWVTAVVATTVSLVTIGINIALKLMT